MNFKRQNDKSGRRVNRTFNIFRGSHYGTGKTDSADDFGYLSDFNCMHLKPWLRDGCRKNQETGYTRSITSLFSIHFGGYNLVASVENGVLTVYPASDVLEGHRRYYNVSELASEFTVEEAATAQTVNSLIEGAD